METTGGGGSERERHKSSEEKERERERIGCPGQRKRRNISKKGDGETEVEQMTRDGERMPFGL